MAYGINLVAKLDENTGQVLYETYLMEDGQMITETIIDPVTGTSTQVPKNFGYFRRLVLANLGSSLVN